MNKNLLIFILVLGIVGVFLLRPRKVTEIIDNTNYELVDSLMDSVAVLKSKTVDLDIKQAKYEAIADSLSAYISSHTLECPEIVELQDKEIKALRTGLKLCNESKAVMAVTIKTLDTIQVVNNVIIGDIKKECKINLKKEKRRSFLTGAGVGGAVVLVALLLL